LRAGGRGAAPQTFLARALAEFPLSTLRAVEDEFDELRAAPIPLGAAPHLAAAAKNP
jgi:hypothetical protein